MRMPTEVEIAAVYGVVVFVLGVLGAVLPPSWRFTKFAARAASDYKGIHAVPAAPEKETP